MLYRLEEFNKTVEITGYCPIDFVSVENFLKANRKQTQQAVEVQFFDAQLIATAEHLYFAVLNALHSFKTQTNTSKSVAMETILYASGQGQIQKAIQCSGLKFQSKSMAVVIVGADRNQTDTMLKEITRCVGSEPNDAVLKLNDDKVECIKRTFGITDKEINAVTKDGDAAQSVVDLVLERVALLATEL
jgi:KEOPS complex subunit Cgi121